jgi:hypothetical protein
VQAPERWLDWSGTTPDSLRLYLSGEREQHTAAHQLRFVKVLEGMRTRQTTPNYFCYPSSFNKRKKTTA